MLRSAITTFCLLLLFLFCNCNRSPSPALSPEESRKRFQLAEDLDIELVAAEPLVQDPVVMHFDDAGRLWVVEMRGFMPNVDGKGKEERNGRIAVLEDEDGDGRMDKRTTFLDSLILPRSLAIVKDGALVAERKPLWWAKDLDGDLRADTMILVDSEYGERGLVEHSPNGLWRGLDNWYYNAKSGYRYRLTGDQWIKDTTERRGQWGISHDDFGRLYYNYNWSQLHADIVPPNELMRNPHHHPTSGIDHGLTIDRRIFPIRPNPAVNRGYIPNVFDEQGRLREFTSACSPFVYRGHYLGSDFAGNAFVCAPSANLVKRNLVLENGLYLEARHAYVDREFLASTDERFRPVFLNTGPDGALYIADMYRGVVQDNIYITPYLRKQVLERKLELPIHLGRIWRVASKVNPSGQKTDLSRSSNEELIELLANANGWYRDIAQRLLVERQDTNAIRPLKRFSASTDTPLLGRIHALWTLEGLGNRNPDTYFPFLEDPSEEIVVTALRLLSPIVRSSSALQQRLDDFFRDKDGLSEKVALHFLLVTRDFDILNRVATPKLDLPVMRDAVMSSLQDQEANFLEYLLKVPDWQQETPPRKIFLEMLSLAIGRKNNHRELDHLQRLTAGEDGLPKWQKEAIQNGLNLSPGAVALSPEIKQDSNLLSPQEQASYTAGRQLYLNTCSGCHGVDGQGMDRFAPPLRQSEWVLGNEKKLALILLHGMEGPLSVNGKLYDVPEIMPVMPSLSTISDRDLAATLTYVRRSWGHRADAVAPGTVGKVRHRMQGKVTPWTSAELSTLDPKTIAAE